jgi:metal-dependent hydrolase (beta-lactamase superfamily II)
MKELSFFVITDPHYFSEKLGNQKINAIVISHYHYDHIGGLNGLKPILSDNCVVYLPMNFNGYITGEEDIEELNTIRNSVISSLITNNIKYVHDKEGIHHETFWNKYFNDAIKYWENNN